MTALGSCARALEAGPGARLRDCLAFDNPEWQDAVAFDAAMRGGYARALVEGKPLHGEAFVHRSMLPLDQAPIDKATAAEWKTRQTTVFDHLADADDDDRGCSPWARRGEDED
jgi:hypothetical protein